MSLSNLSERWQKLFCSLKPATQKMTGPSQDPSCGQLELLSAWNQNSPRVYICVMLCFPLLDNSIKQATDHLRNSLKRLARERPLFSSRLRTCCDSHHGLAHLERSPAYEIPFETSPPGKHFNVTYAQAKEKGFPPDLFINPLFAVPGTIEAKSGPLPVSMVHAFFVDGGLFLGVYLHHSLCDGDSLRVFLECFAAQTRGEEIVRPSDQSFTDKTRRSSTKKDFGKLISNCPEYAILSNTNGPTQPRFLRDGKPLELIEKTGKIFVFSKSRIEELQDMMRSELDLSVRPSKYTCLAALAFVHISQARIEGEDFLPEAKEAWEAMLWNSVSWRKRAFKGQTDEYFGNAALPAVTRAPIELLRAARADTTKLAEVVPLIRESIDAVDEEYVQQRLAMITALADPRHLGVNYDPRMPEVLAFNTWRHFGAEAEWTIPGSPAAQPEAIRRAHGSWNLGTALILPARSTSPSQELFVSLSKSAMDLLCDDDEWLKWVDKVIG